MTYRDTVKEIVYSAWQGKEASQATQEDLEVMAGLIADAVANAVQLNLVGDLEEVANQLAVLAGVFSSWQPQPGDGGSTLKAALSASGVPTALASYANALKAKAAAYS